MSILEQSPSSARTRVSRTRLGKAFSAASWPAALGLLAASLAWPISGEAWTLDLIANFNAQWLGLALPGVLLWLLTRRWAHAAVAAVACGSLLISLASGRAAILPRPAHSSLQAAAVADPLHVRFFHINASTNSTGDTIEQCMRDSGADVFSVLCPSVAYQRDVIYGDRLADRFPGKLTRLWRPEPDGSATDITAAFLVARWPMKRIDTPRLGAMSDYLITAVVERPAGAFAVIAVHPRSPRSAARWALGNAVTDAVATATSDLEALGYPVAVLTDLNSTPSGHRSRVLEAAGLRRAKPLLVATGTYPVPIGPRDDTQAGPRRCIAWPWGIAIDDVLLSSQIELLGWGTMPRLDSEHSPIIVDTRIPVRLAGSLSPAGR